MSINQRFKLLIKILKTNPSAFGRSIGVTQAAIKGILDGTSLPSSKILIPLLQTYPDININWLLIEQGDMYIEDTATTKERIEQRDKMISILESSVKNLEHTVHLQKKTLEERDITIQALQEQLE